MNPNNTLLVEWLQTNKRNQAWLAQYVGVTRSAVSQWYNGSIPVPDWLVLVLNLTDRVAALEQQAHTRAEKIAARLK